MRRYRYSYHTIVSYDALVTHHAFQLRSMPHENSCQHIVSHAIDHLKGFEIAEGEDCFGNTIYYGCAPEFHDLFVVASVGVVQCESYRVEDVLRVSPIYLSSTRMTHLSPQLMDFAREVTPQAGGSLQRAEILASAIYNRMCYQAGVTTTETTAAQSFEMGQGVCQDFAHILIALCRNCGVNARYCVGFLVGTGETHAWVEVYVESEGVWYGVDPTHNRIIEYDYIKIAHGRDASDCSVIRGVHRGRAEHTTQIRVVVEEV